MLGPPPPRRALPHPLASSPPVPTPYKGFVQLLLTEQALPWELHPAPFQPWTLVKPLQTLTTCSGWAGVQKSGEQGGEGAARRGAGHGRRASGGAHAG